MNISEKKQVKCSFCDHQELTDKTAYVCEECTKNLQSIYCPGCGAKIIDKDKDIVNEHLFKWHNRCKTIFSVTRTQSMETFGISNKSLKKYLYSSEPYLYHDLSDITINSRELKNPYDITEIKKKLELSTDKTSELDSETINLFESTITRLFQRGLVNNIVEEGKIYNNVISGENLLNFILNKGISKTEEEAIQFCKKLKKYGYISLVFEVEEKKSLEKDNSSLPSTFTNTTKNTNENSMNTNATNMNSPEVLKPISDMNQNNKEKESQTDISINKDSLDNIFFQGKQELYYVNKLVNDMNSFKTNETQPREKYIKKSGWLNYCDTYNGQYKKWWCELSSHMLSSFNDPDGGKIDCLDVREFETSQCDKQKTLYDFVIKLESAARILYLQCETEADMLQWLTALSSESK